jgi:hypothetical protein
MTTRRHPRVPCWPRRASRAGCRGSGCTSRRNKLRTYSSSGRFTNSSSTASTRIRIPSEYVPRVLLLISYSTDHHWPQPAETLVCPPPEPGSASGCRCAGHGEGDTVMTGPAGGSLAGFVHAALCILVFLLVIPSGVLVVR